MGPTEVAELVLTLASLSLAAALAWQGRTGGPLWVGAPARSLRIVSAWSWVAGSSLRSILAVVAFALVLRIALLPWLGPPIPVIHDEFSLLLQARTFLLGRLANAPPPLAEHFETFHVNVRPAYQSVFFPGRSAALLVGELIGHAWIGVLLCFAALCGAVTWALRGCLPGGFALAAGLLLAWRYGGLSYWVNSYWGGALAALGGALVVGAALRLRPAGVAQGGGLRRGAANGFVLGLGAFLLMTSRPFEGFLLCLPIALALLAGLLHGAVRRQGAWALAVVVPATAWLVGGLVVLVSYDIATTGKARLTPYELNRSVYAIAPAFLSSPLLDGPKRGDPAMRAFYDWEAGAHRRGESLPGLARAMGHKLWTLWSFYVGMALTLPVILGSARLARERPSLVLGGGLLLVGVLDETWDLAHYAAPAQVLVALAAALGMHALWTAPPLRQRWTRPLAAGLVAAASLPIIVPMSLVVAGAAGGSLPAFSITAPCCWFGPPADSGRPLYEANLRQLGERHLVIVRTSPADPLHESWIWNEPDLDAASIVWARSLGPARDAELVASMPDRQVWRVEDVRRQTTQPPAPHRQ